MTLGWPHVLGVLAAGGLLSWAALRAPVGGAAAKAGPDGRVPGKPSDLAASAGAGLDIYALGRVIASEASILVEAAKVAVAWAVKNEAARRGVSISKLLLGSEDVFATQSYGRGRYASTAQPPSVDDLETARRVWLGTVADPTGGATKWDSPRAQRALLARNADGYSKTPEQVAAAREAEGFELVVLAGVDAEKIRFWRKA